MTIYSGRDLQDLKINTKNHEDNIKKTKEYPGKLLTMHMRSRIMNTKRKKT